MARQLRVEYPGAVYHVTVRSNGGELLFKSDEDRRYLLSRIAEAVEFHGVRVYLYCLMSNHFHLVAETPKGNLGRFMQGVLTGYGVYFNRAWRRHGHVTQGRYGARLVEGDGYLLKLSRYVHLNPVKVKSVAAKPVSERLEMLRNYRWSSYPAYIGAGARNRFVDYRPMLALVEGRKGEAEKRYRSYVESGIETEDNVFLVELQRSARSIGSERFREWVNGLYQELTAKHGVKEDVSFRRTAGRVAVERILDLVAEEGRLDRGLLLKRQRDSRWRAVATRMLCKYGGLTQRECARTIGLQTGVAVCCQLRQLNRLVEFDPGLRKCLEKIDSRLAEEARATTR
jgi:putative transposase